MASVEMILGYFLTNGHLVALVVSAVLLSPCQLLERSLLANEQEVSNHGYEKLFEKNWTQPNVREAKESETKKACRSRR